MNWRESVGGLRSCSWRVLKQYRSSIIELSKGPTRNNKISVLYSNEIKNFLRVVLSKNIFFYLFFSGFLGFYYYIQNFFFRGKFFFDEYFFRRNIFLCFFLGTKFFSQNFIFRWKFFFVKYFFRAKYFFTYFF